MNIPGHKSIAKWNLLWLCFLLNFQMSICSICSINLNSFVSTHPQGDIVVKYGDPLRILCMVDPNLSGGTYNHLTFRRGQNNLSQYVKIIDNTTIELSISKPERQGNYYYCIYSYNNKSDQCGNYVVVDSAPMPVENFHCYSEGLANLTCEWNYNAYIVTNFTIAYYRRFFPPVHQNVTNKVGNKYSYTWPTFNGNHRMITVELSSKNQWGNNTNKYSVNVLKFLKLAKPDDLSVSNITSNSALLHWKIPTEITSYEVAITFKIEYLIFSSNEWRRASANNTIIQDNYKFTWPLYDLPYANEHYKISISYKSIVANDSFWSPSGNITFHTLSIRPARPPDTIPGCFDIPNYNLPRTVYVYWRRIEDYEKNGEDFKYIVIEHNQGLVRQNNGSNYAIFKDTKGDALNVSIRSSNKDGYSEDTSYVNVPAKDDVLQPPTLFTKKIFGDGTYQLSWQMSNFLNITSFSLFWCVNSVEQFNLCNGKLNFTTIPGHLRTYSITLPRNTTMYAFAISANNEVSSSGMVWASCAFSPSQIVSPIRDFTFEETTSTSIKLKWSLQCTYEHGDIKSYIINYCRLNAARKCIEFYNQTASENSSSITLTNLKPYTTYSITIAVESKNGIGQGTNYQRTTSEDAPSPPAVTVYDITNTSAVVDWDEPLEMNGKLHMYKIHYGIINDTSRDILYKTIEIKSNLSTRTYKLNNLDSFTNYSIYVDACTGRPDCSDNRRNAEIIRTAIGRPSIITQPIPINTVEVNPTMFNITWNAPEKTGSANVDLYQVKVTRSNGNWTIFNTANEYYEFEPLCNNGDNNVDIAVRAVNFDSDPHHGVMRYTQPAQSVDNEESTMLTYEGDWSVPYRVGCFGASSSFDWVLWSLLAVLLILTSTFGSKKLWEKYKDMSTVPITLPPILVPILESNEKSDKSFPLIPPSNNVTEQPPKNSSLHVAENESGSSVSTDSSSVSVSSKSNIENSPHNSNNSSIRSTNDAEKTNIQYVSWSLTNDSPKFGDTEDKQIVYTTSSYVPLENVEGGQCDFQNNPLSFAPTISFTNILDGNMESTKLSSPEFECDEDEEYVRASDELKGGRTERNLKLPFQSEKAKLASELCIPTTSSSSISSFDGQINALLNKHHNIKKNNSDIHEQVVITDPSYTAFNPFDFANDRSSNIEELLATPNHIN